MKRNVGIVLSGLLLTVIAALAAEDSAGTYVGEYDNKAGKSGG